MLTNIKLTLGTKYLLYLYCMFDQTCHNCVLPLGVVCKEREINEEKIPAKTFFQAQSLKY